MLINLKVDAIKTEEKPFALEIKERLPSQLSPPCIVKGKYTVEDKGHYYLLSWVMEGTFNLLCQRCLKQYDFHQQFAVQLAIASSEELANKLMSQYECIVSCEGKVDLTELITDELHLSIPERHRDMVNCGSEIRGFIKSQ